MARSTQEPAELQVHIDMDELTRLLQMFCEERGLAEAAIAMERESGIPTHLHGRDVAWIRELCLAADFQSLREVIHPLKRSLEVQTDPIIPLTRPSSSSS